MEDSFSAETFFDLNLSYGHWFFQGEALAVPGGVTYLTQPQYESLGSMVWQKRINPQRHWVAEFAVAYEFVTSGSQAGVAFFLAEDWIGPYPKPQWPTETLLHPSCYTGRLLGVSVDADYKWRIIADYNDGRGPQVLSTYTYNPPYEYFTVRLIYGHVSKRLRLITNGIFVTQATVDTDFLPSQVQLGLQGAGKAGVGGANSYPTYNLPRASWTIFNELSTDIQTRNLASDWNRSEKRPADPWPTDGLWSPAGLPLRAWYDPSAPGGIHQSDFYVDVLYDLSGNGRHATQPLTSLGPALQQSPFRFRKALLFEGSQSMNLPADIAAGDGSTSLFMAFRSTLPEGAPRDYATGEAFVSLDARVNSEGLITGPYPLSAANWGVSFTADNKLPGNAHPHAWNWLYNRQVGILAANGSIYSDGHLIETRGTYSTTVAYLGRNAGGSLFYNGWIGEILLVDGAVTQPVREKIEGYLAWKWGVRDRLPLSHPYRTTPPLSDPAP